ncbi:DNAj-like protein [Cryptosporidium canis]|uniref:DNAj-like protein n=1 Tax=Cryptosporidium canis TaxID=195482 RepID=A0A9D5HXJ5_9CRYT|nr:DNAj-like protein [Cryptosporidium canis]
MRETVSEETCGSESGETGRRQDQDGDDLFDLFMREVGEGGGDREGRSRRSKRARVSRLLMEGRIEEAISSSYGGEDLAMGTSEEEILRLTSRVFTNAYEVLGLPVDSEAAVISRKYRKLSLLIHPDKTRHEKAREAFETVRRAYEELQQAENRTKYREVWKRAEELVRKENKKRNKALSKKSDESKHEFNKQVIEMSEKLLNDLKERREYSERCLLANHRFEQELYRQKLDQEKEMCIQRQKWSEKFEERAQGWRSYKQSNSKLFSGKSSLEKDD